MPIQPPPKATQAVKEVTFDDVKLELKKGDAYDASALTPKVKKLDGKAIRIRGYILPSFQQNRHQAVRAGPRQHGVLLRPGGAAARLHSRGDGAAGLRHVYRAAGQR